MFEERVSGYRILGVGSGWLRGSSAARAKERPVTDPVDGNGNPFIYLWSTSCGPGARPPGLQWEASPGLTSQAGGRCKPANVQLLFIQQEAGPQVQPGESAGYSATSRHTLQLSCPRSWTSKLFRITPSVSLLSKGIPGIGISHLH